MLTPAPTIVTAVSGVLGCAAIVYAIDRSLGGAARARYRYVLAGLTVGLLVLILRGYIRPYDARVSVAKAIVASVAAACVLYEGYRAYRNRPVAEGVKRVVGIMLALIAIACYFNGFTYSFPPYWHHSDIFHYYMGAKYFPELRYDGLYQCTAIAQDQLGTVGWRNETSGQRFHLDMSSEIRNPEKRIRNLGGDNLLMPVTEVLEHPDRCTSRFSTERWNAFKADVFFFRIVADRQYWEDMQKDHGYNPPPAWTILGSFFSHLRPASARYMQFLASLDMVYLAGAFAMIWWAFGWRVCAVAAIFWGCQAAAPGSWTAGAFLRQDWFFFLIASACFARKRYFKLAGASIVYAGLLRVFPVLIVLGWFAVMGAFVVRRKRLARSHRDVLIGGLVAAAVIIPFSLYIAGPGSYREFYHHTLRVHDWTPLTNHMGLPVLMSYRFGGGAASGRMEYTVDPRLADPFEGWKQRRNERREMYRWPGFAIIAISGALVVWAVRRLRLLWVSGCLGQVFIVLGAQLTSYYYSFLILSALLTGARRRLEIPLFGFAALSQVVFWVFPWNDDKYAALTLMSLLLCYGLILGFVPKASWRRRAELGGCPPAG